MQVLIDTFSDLGMADYTACVQYTKNAKIVRRLNKPTLCTLPLFLGCSNLPIPVVLASIQILTSTGVPIFTGYVSNTLEARAIGKSDAHCLATLTLSAMSDEILLDADAASSPVTLLGLPPQQAWDSVTRLSARPLRVTLADPLVASSRILIEAGSRWSHVAEMLASQTGSSYRCISGAVGAYPVGQIVHAIAADDPGLSLRSTPVSDIRWLAQDITICGREEPTAYVSEIFVGDGSTSSFALSQSPFSPASEQKISLLDLFQGTTLNSKVWQVIDPGAHVALAEAGLTCNGGTGRDGEAIIFAWNQIELGGSITIEATGVSILPGSKGSIVGIYTGTVPLADCLAGYKVSSLDQGVLLAAEIAGISVGSSFTLQSGHIYTLRLRIYSPEMERVRQSYFSSTDSGPVVVGGNAVGSEGQVVFEIQDTTNAVLGATKVLFSGTLIDLPLAGVLGLIDSGNLSCSIRSIRCSQSGPLKVTVGPSLSSQSPVSLAPSVDGGSCHVTAAGALKFYPATIPSMGELVIVNYRLKSIAVARRLLPSSPPRSMLPPTLSWIGSVAWPIAWSSNDCDNVATAMLGPIASGLPVLEGTYACNLAGTDIWPGDLLAIGPQADESMLEVTVQASTILLSPEMPEVYACTIEFATPTIAGVGFKLSSAIPLDVLLPQGQTNVGEELVSLSAMTIKDITGTTITIVTGLAPPSDGGFEVRRRDATFGPGIDSDLVLRTSAMEVSIPRSNPVEQFYIRMYDACQPPNYSQFSAAVFLNASLGG